MSYGVTAQGFAAKSLEVIKAELEADWRAEFGDSCDLDPQAPDGQIIGIFSERFAELWELAEGVYAAFDPDEASGTAQDGLAALTGTVREPAIKSTVTVTLTGDVGTTIAAGKVVSVDGTGTRFAADAEATLAEVAELLGEGAGDLMVLGALRASSTGVYRCSKAGNLADPLVDLVGTGVGIASGTSEWDFLGDGLSSADVACSAEETGPKVAVARTLTVIETPVSGWKGVRNILDAVLGADLETDAALRVRREDELRATGNAAADAVRADVLRVAGVTACTVFANETDAVDVDGLPPHSIEVLVQGGTDAAVAAAIWASKGAGIATYGSTTESVTDAAGAAHDVNFSRPTEKNVYVKVTLAYDADLYPSDGDDQVKAAIVAFGDAQATGKNVVASSVGAKAFGVPGVLDTSEVLVGLVNPPVASTSIAISLRELAVFDTSRITIVSASSTP